MQAVCLLVSAAYLNAFLDKRRADRYPCIDPQRALATCKVSQVRREAVVQNSIVRHDVIAVGR